LSIRCLFFAYIVYLLSFYRLSVVCLLFAYCSSAALFICPSCRLAVSVSMVTGQMVAGKMVAFFA